MDSRINILREFLKPGSEENRARENFIIYMEKMLKNISEENLDYFEKNYSTNDSFHKNFLNVLSSAEKLKSGCIPYSELTRMVYSICANSTVALDGIDAFNKRFMEEINKSLNMHPNDNPTKYILLIKSLEHIQLAYKQKTNLYNSQEKEINDLLDKIANLDKKIKSSKKRISEINNIKSSIYGDFIAILGIFTAITFATFGGLQLLSNIFGNINKLSSNDVLGKVLILSSLFGTMIFGVIETLLSWINEIKNSEKHKTNYWILIFWGLIFIVGVLFILTCHS